MTVKCPKCHFDNPSDTRFCGQCAAAFERTKNLKPELFNKQMHAATQ